MMSDTAKYKVYRLSRMLLDSQFYFCFKEN